MTLCIGQWKMECVCGNAEWKAILWIYVLLVYLKLLLQENTKDLHHTTKAVKCVSIYLSMHIYIVNGSIDDSNQNCLQSNDCVTAADGGDPFLPRRLT